MTKVFLQIINILVVLVLFFTSTNARAESCDVNSILDADEKSELLEELDRTKVGHEMLLKFIEKYESLNSLSIHWDTVSYSKINSTINSTKGRTLASSSGIEKSESFKSDLNSGSNQQLPVCIHLTKRLPHIEHLADLIHELTHAVRLSSAALNGEMNDVEDFVNARISASGGEADAFKIECELKNEILGKYDSFCSPFVQKSGVNVVEVIKALYNGELSASLTGETYPVMLSKQFNFYLKKKSVH